MKTNKLPQSAWTGLQAAGSQSQQHDLDSQSSTGYMTYDNMQQTECASNDVSYESELSQAIAKQIADSKEAYKATVSDIPYVEKAITIDGSYKKANNNSSSLVATECSPDILPKQIQRDHQSFISKNNDSLKRADSLNNKSSSKIAAKQLVNKRHSDVSERVFMNCLIKHTGIALAIIVPLAAFSAYAAPSIMPINTSTVTAAVEPIDIIYNNAATVPTTVASVDLAKYAGTWHEIGRLPMYFQRNCARDVTATYTPKVDGSGIVITNKCIEKNGEGITAEGFAKSVDDTGSKLQVTFLPSWIRWLPVGRADYWVLARDADYQTALVGTPDNDYLWLLARTPNVTQRTYAKYRQIAQQQGYDLKEFNLTPQTGQTINLVP